MEKLLVSIIIPAYNAGNYIDNCFDMLLKQEYKDIEIIFVNDGSKDNTLEKLRQIEKQDKRVIVVDKENGGPASARNKGIELATGSYVAFIDVDDIIDSNYISNLVENIDDAEICFCKYEKVDKANNTSYIPKFPQKKITLSGAKSAKYIFNSGAHTMMISPCCKLIKTSYLKNYHFLNGRRCEDEEWSYRLIYNAKKIIFTNKPFYRYICNEGSDSRVIFFDRLFDSATNEYEKMIFFKRKSIKLCVLSAISFYNNITSLLYIYKGDKEKYNKLKGLYKKVKLPFLKMLFYKPISLVRILLKIFRYKVKR